MGVVAVGVDDVVVGDDTDVDGAAGDAAAVGGGFCSVNVYDYPLSL